MAVSKLIILLFLTISLNSSAQSDSVQLKRLAPLGHKIFSQNAGSLFKSPRKKETKRYSLDSFVLEKGAIIMLPNVLFKPGLNIMIKDAYHDLNHLAKILTDNPTLKIELQGHICCRVGGVDAYDPNSGLENLSTNRAKSVYSYLIKKGIDKNRLSYTGFGSLKKLIIDDQVDPEAQKINRRVDAKIIDI